MDSVLSFNEQIGLSVLRDVVHLACLEMDEAP